MPVRFVTSFVCVIFEDGQGTGGWGCSWRWGSLGGAALSAVTRLGHYGGSFHVLFHGAEEAARPGAVTEAATAKSALKPRWLNATPKPVSVVGSLGTSGILEAVRTV